MSDEILPEDKPKRGEQRGQHCIKHAKVTKELIALCRNAARKADLGLNEWMCDALQREAERTLGLPVIADVRESLMDIAQRLDRLEHGVPPGAETKDSGGFFGRILGPKRP